MGLRRILVAGASFALIAQSATAAELVFDYSKSLSNNVYPYLNSPWNPNFFVGTSQSLPVFDTRLGVLDSLTIAYEAEDHQSYSGTPDPTAPTNEYPGYPSYWAGGIVKGQAFEVATGSVAQGQDYLVQNVYYELYDAEAAFPLTSTPLTHDFLFSDSITVSDTAKLAALMGSGQVSAYLGHLGADVGTGIENIVYTETASDHLRLTYSYTPNAVPEPVTWAMLIGGVGVIGGAMRRRQRLIASAI